MDSWTGKYYLKDLPSTHEPNYLIHSARSNKGTSNYELHIQEVPKDRKNTHFVPAPQETISNYSQNEMYVPGGDYSYYDNVDYNINRDIRSNNQGDRYSRVNYTASTHTGRATPPLERAVSPQEEPPAPDVAGFPDPPPFTCSVMNRAKPLAVSTDKHIMLVG